MKTLTTPVTRRSVTELSLIATEEECRTLKSALNQVLELSDSDYSTLIGGPKKRSLALLKTLGDALKEAAPAKTAGKRKASK